MSSCMSGGGRAYRLGLDIIKSPSNSWTSYSSSPSSTLTESSNFSTRKPRTPRKRPNQTYNEAAAILSTAYPKIFPTTKSSKSYNHSSQNPLLFDPTSDLITPFQVIIDTSEFLLHNQPPNAAKTPPVEVISSFEKQCQSPEDIEITSCQVDDDYRGDFGAESILAEDIGEGIDSIMGNLEVENESQVVEMSTCYGYPVGLLGFEFGDGMRSEIRATRRNVDEEGDWWRFPSVVNFVTATHNKTASHNKNNKNKKKKKKKKVDDIITNSEIKHEDKLPIEEEECVVPQLLLKLNYDDVLKAWSDKDSPFSGDAPGVQNDVQARLAQIDLFSENGVREASVLRYKEKRRTRLFSKKIRYQVRKVNADRRPRMKGRFVRNPNSPDNEQL